MATKEQEAAGADHRFATQELMGLDQENLRFALNFMCGRAALLKHPVDVDGVPRDLIERLATLNKAYV